MSVIIRLQNLPLSAKSSDIRQFFRGLHIPDGGVHIIGGEKGDAFIAFNSDEDARIGMRKDGGKIKDSRVKLFLSSHMEMQYQIERITKHEAMMAQKSSGKWKSSYSRRSPQKFRNRSPERNSHGSDEFRSYSPLEERAKYNRQHSPRRSRSPPYDRSWSPNYRRSPSPRHRSPRRMKSRSKSPGSYAESFHVSDSKRSSKEYSRDSENPYQDKYYGDSHRSRNVRIASDMKNEFSSSEEEQRHLEERITKALNTGFVENAFGIKSSLDDKFTMNTNPPPVVDQFPQQNTMHGDVPVYMNNVQHQPPFAPNYNVAPMNTNVVPPPAFIPPPTLPPPFPNQAPFAPPAPFLPPAPVVPPAPFLPPPAPVVQKPVIPFTGYYVTISGLDPLWTNSDLQAMLKGMFAPQDNIRWEVDDAGFKTGTAFLKIMNRDDFHQILSQATYVYNDRLITVSECPNIVYEKYFPPPLTAPLPGQAIIQDGELYYRIRGLPFTITHEEIMHFFYGFQIADIYLESEPSGRMTGTGYICFSNISDYDRARIMHGRKLGHGTIELIPCARQEMVESKRRNKGYFNPNSFQTNIPFTQHDNAPQSQKRPLCALLTGLPPLTKIPKIAAFFKEHGLKPDAIHLIVNKKRQPTGRGFVEFSNIRDFDAALKCHGNKLGKNIICVKQILFDEMTQILSSQKAKHDYGNNATNLVQIDLPERAPYIWDPPDNDNFSKNSEINPWKNNSNTYNIGHNQNNSPAYEQYTQSHIPPSYEKNSFESKTNRKVEFSKRNFSGDERYRDEGRVLPHMTRKLDESNIAPNSSTVSDDYLREPVKFEVKLKQPVAKNTKADNFFDRNMKGDIRQKLTKLTPEKEIKKMNSSKVVREIKNKELLTRAKQRSRSPPETRKRDESLRGNVSLKKFDERRYKRPSRGESPLHDYYSQDPFIPPHRSRSRSPSRNEYLNKSRDKYRYEESPREVIVEMSNVHPQVGPRELQDFFCDFNVDTDKMIRRYGERGEPLGDIRVIFSSTREALRAVRYLNGMHLNGSSVDMTLVE